MQMVGMLAPQFVMFDKNSQHGFIALLSVVIIGLTLLLGVVALGQRGITGRLVLLDLERKAQSESYARGCIEMVRIQIGNDPSYASGVQTLTVGSGTCTVVSVSPNTPSVGFSRIQATSTVFGANTRLQAVINASAGPSIGTIYSSKEVITFN